MADDAPTPLVVATTYDAATPAAGGLALVEDLGNARLLTMRGDGHTAYGGQSACIDAAVEAYLVELALPDEGATCEQDVPFTAPEAPEEAPAEEAPVEEPAAEEPAVEEPAEAGAARLARR